MNDKPNDVAAIEQAIVTTATKITQEYLDRAWGLIDEHVVTDAAGSVAIIAELLMEKDVLREQFTRLSLASRQPLNKALRAECPTQNNELTIAAVGLHHTGKTLLTILLSRLLADVGVTTKLVDEEAELSAYYINTPNDVIIGMLNGTGVGQQPKNITLTSRSIGRTYELDPYLADAVHQPTANNEGNPTMDPHFASLVDKPSDIDLGVVCKPVMDNVRSQFDSLLTGDGQVPMDKLIPVGAIINLPESPEIALGEIIQLRNT